MGRLRERLRQYLQDREPLALDGMELGFFPTKGRYDAAAVFRAATEAGADPWPLLAADGRALAAFLKRRPDAERTLAPAWTPSPPWFGHRKVAASPENRRARTSTARECHSRRQIRSGRSPDPSPPGQVRPNGASCGRGNLQSPMVTAPHTSRQTGPTTEGERMPTPVSEQETTASGTRVAEIPSEHVSDLESSSPGRARTPRSWRPRSSSAPTHSVPSWRSRRGSRHTASGWLADSGFPGQTRTRVSEKSTDPADTPAASRATPVRLLDRHRRSPLGGHAGAASLVPSLDELGRGSSSGRRAAAGDGHGTGRPVGLRRVTAFPNAGTERAQPT